jgi:hypothetical protein
MLLSEKMTFITMIYYWFRNGARVWFIPSQSFIEGEKWCKNKVENEE